MLLLLQAAARLPSGAPIYVTVQQPPGLPIWITALISAAVGAVFAIVTGIGMEYVKPYISKRLARQTVSRELDDEFAVNFQNLMNAVEIIADAEQGGGEFVGKALETASMLLTGFRTDRFLCHFEKDKTIYYEIDRERNLASFYEIVKDVLPEAIRLKKLDLIALPCMLMEGSGTKYAQAHGLPIPTLEPYWREMYLKMPEDGTLPVID